MQVLQNEDEAENNFLDGVIANHNNMTANNEEEDQPEKKSKKRFISPLQVDHIKRVRQFVENRGLYGVDWRNIHLGLEGVSASDPELYYIKASAVWVPHLLIKNHRPYCPTCKDPVPSIIFQ